MKTYSYLYYRCISDDNREIAADDTMKSKRVKKVMRRRHKNVNYLITESEEWLTNYQNDEHTIKIVTDGASHKQREIIIPTPRELMVQHCLVNVMKSMFMCGMYEHSYACIPGRGSHKAKKLIEKWIRKGHGIKYVLKMDIRKFFGSIPHEILKKKLEEKIKDDRFLDILFKVIDTTDKGLPLGFYTSQWLANWYLQDFDHFVKEQLRAEKYVRYCDDMAIFSNNKRELHNMRRAISEYLSVNLGLELKSNWQIFRFDHDGKGRDLDFMGFRFYRDRTILRKSILYRITRKARRISCKLRPTIYDARQMLSRLGYLKCTDVYSAYKERIKPFINFGRLKRIVSLYDKHSEINAYKTIVAIYS